MTTLGGEPRALCIVRDPVLRRTLRRTLGATGSHVEFVDEPTQATAPARLVFVDAKSRAECTSEALHGALAEGGRVVILGDSLDDFSLVRLLRDDQLDHVITDLESPEESELVVTSSKLISGDLFGLEKYLTWGAAVHELEVVTTDEKRAAVARVAGYAEGVGARRATVTKIESAVDELLMNALYDAPAAHRHAKTGRLSRGTGAPRPTPERPIGLLRYGCDGRYFAISVSDNYGLLEKRILLDSLMRAHDEKGKPVDHSISGGAGLGFYMVLASVTRFIVNLDPGVRTEVVCLIDLRAQGKEASPWARSLHIFTTASTPLEVQAPVAGETISAPVTARPATDDGDAA